MLEVFISLNIMIYIFFNKSKIFEEGSLIQSTFTNTKINSHNQDIDKIKFLTFVSLFSKDQFIAKKQSFMTWLTIEKQNTKV